MPDTGDVIKTGGEAALYALAPPFFWAYEAWNAAEHSVEETAQKLEEQHKLLFATLALTNNTYCNMFKKFSPEWRKMKKAGKDFTKTPEFKTLLKLGIQVKKAAQDWFKTQTDLEAKAKIKKAPIKIDDFLVSSKAVTILKYAQTFFKKNISGSDISEAIQHNGIGIVPVVIVVAWASAIVVASVSVAYMVSRMTISTQDRIDLLNATKKTCEDLNLTPEECAGVINTAQTEETKNSKGVTDAADAVGGGLTKIAFLAAAAYVLVQLTKNKN